MPKSMYSTYQTIPETLHHSDHLLLRTVIFNINTILLEAIFDDFRSNTLPGYSHNIARRI